MKIVSLNLECSQTISYNEFIIYPGHGFYDFFMMTIIMKNYSREVCSVLSSTDTVLLIPVVCLLIRSIQCTSTCQRLSAIKSLLCNINDFLNAILKEEKHEKSSYPERIAIPRRRHVNPFGSSLRRTSNH